MFHYNFLFSEGIMMGKLYLVSLFAAVSMAGVSLAASQDYLVKFNGHDTSAQSGFLKRNGGKLSLVSTEGNLYKWTTDRSVNLTTIATAEREISYVQRNHVYHIFESPSLTANRDAILKAIRGGAHIDESWFTSRADKPEINEPPTNVSTGTDPLLKDAWGMFKIGADAAWPVTNRGKGIVVAVTDTGVDYNHEDLIANMWRNPHEIPANQIDDDKNGYVDDVVGWDFVTNDRKPYDITKSLMEIILQGGNPGHGTHCSGVIGASLNNSVGTSGVAPEVKIMALRFISEDGKGTTEAAIKAIDYAVKNGANIISASWGGEAGDDDDKSLKESIERAAAKGVIFVAAAGNGRAGADGKPAGFDNDSDKKPMVPASMGVANIISVAAINSDEKLADFSNWGHKTTQLGAPGVKVLSTVPGNKYQDTVVDLGGMKVTWDGTSMAAPFVSGALAVVWSQNPTQSWEETKQALLSKTTALESLHGKVVTDGRLELRNIKEEVERP